MNEVEEIKGRIDIVDLVGQYVSLKKAGTNYKGVCPFHQEKTPSLMVSPQKQIWKCFGCGKGGDHFSFIMEAENLEFGDALKLLAQRAGVTLKPKTQAEHQTQNRKELLFRINALAARIFQKVLWETPEGKSVLEYLKKRKISDTTLKKFGVGFASKKVSMLKLMQQKGVATADISRAGAPDRFFERIIFPIYDVLGNVVGFTGRALGDAQPKYLNSPETPLYNKSRVLYGLNLAKNAIKKEDRIILVEGQMDVIALHQAGVEETVASSGTAITEAQLLILSKYSQNFFLGFDGDAAGLATTEKVIELLLKNDLGGRVLNFGEYKDAGELFEKNPERWLEIKDSATEMVDWVINRKSSQAGDLRFVENKKKVIKGVLPLLQLVPDPTRLDHYAQRVSALLEVSTDSVYAALQKTSSPKTPTSASTSSPARYSLTNEEQLLIFLLAIPPLIQKYLDLFKSVVWQSIDASRIASELEKWYSDKTLVTNQSQFFSRVKTGLDSQLGEKMDAWQFWLTSQWADFSPSLAEELIQEKFRQLSTKEYEQHKTSLASQIKAAQQTGDLAKVKELMKQLNDLTKETKS